MMIILLKMVLIIIMKMIEVTIIIQIEMLLIIIIHIDRAHIKVGQMHFMQMKLYLQQKLPNNFIYTDSVTKTTWKFFWYY